MLVVLIVVLMVVIVMLIVRSVVLASCGCLSWSVGLEGHVVWVASPGLFSKPFSCEGQPINCQEAPSDFYSLQVGLAVSLDVEHLPKIFP